MGIPVAIIDGLSYYCRAWKSTPGQRLVASWNKGWQGGMGEAFRESPNRYMFGEKIDSSTAGYLRAHPKILASIEDADIDATLPVYCIEGTAAAATITFDAAPTPTTGTAGPITHSHTVANQPSRILLVKVNFIGGTSVKVSGITYDGIPLALRSAASLSTLHAELWYLVAPPIGTANVVVTFSGSVTSTVVASEGWYNVSQSAPFSASASTSGTSTTPSIAVTAAVGDVVTDIMAAAGNVTATVGAGQTERYNAIQGTALRAAGSSEAGAASVTMSWTLSSSVPWVIRATPMKPANINVVNVLNGRYRYKINGSSYALMGTKDYGAGAQCGRPALFEGAHYVPLGSTVDARKITAFGTTDETSDTDAAITGSIKAHAFCTLQDAGTSKLARALTNSIDLSSDGADWSAAGFEAGDSTFAITDLLPAPGEMIVIRPDGPLRFDAGGSPLPIQSFSAINASADSTLGSNSHGHGPYAYWVDVSGIWRIIGENATPMGPEAHPDFGAVALDGMTSPFTAGQWRSVTAIGRWLYATHYSSLGSIDGDLFYGYIASDGTVERWHGSLYDSERCLRVQRLSIPALVIVEGKPGDDDTPAIHIMELEADGSPRTRLDGQRAAVPAAGETSEHFAVMPALDWGWLGFADREKQLARIGFTTEGMVTGSSWQMNMWRDANAQQTVGAAVSSDTFTEVEPATPGTSDTFYDLFIAPWLTLTESFAGGDPRLRRLVVEARLASALTVEIDVLRGRPAPNLGFEEALSNLRKLSAGARVPVIGPERQNAINGHVTGVGEAMVGDPDKADWGLRFTLQLETFDIDAGTT